MTRPHLRSIKSQVKKLQQIVTPNEIIIAIKSAGLIKLKQYFLDPDYVALPLEVWIDFLAWSRVDRAKYLVSRYDCENSSLHLVSEASHRLRVNGMGLVLDTSGRHAYTAILCKDGPDEDLYVKCVEPQTDQIVEVGESHSETECYAAQEGMIWWP